MKYGICKLSAMPIRKEGSHTSEMVSQLLFNELYEVLDEKPGWYLIKTIEDQYEGWIQGIQHHEIGEQEFMAHKGKTRYIVDQSTLEHQERLLSIGTVLYEPVPGSMTPPEHFVPALMIEFAQKFLGAPYLWGGRSIFGID